MRKLRIAGEALLLALLFTVGCATGHVVRHELGADAGDSSCR
jgi:hypothetical protein